MNPILANILFQAFYTSGLVNKIIVFALILLSLYTWMTLMGKGADLNIINRKNAAFRKNLKSRPHPAHLYLEAEGAFAPGIPAAAIYSAAMKELLDIMRIKGIPDEHIHAWRPGMSGVALSETEMATIKALAEGELSEQILFIESRMSSLATLTTTAPSLGLFGTVWGVMESFMAMTSAGSAMITSVAPGISGALLTTVLGLFVAIPSSIGYNTLGDKVKSTIVKTENFTDELMSSIARIYVFGTGEA